MTRIESAVMELRKLGVDASALMSESSPTLKGGTPALPTRTAREIVAQRRSDPSCEAPIVRFPTNRELNSQLKSIAATLPPELRQFEPVADEDLPPVDCHDRYGLMSDHAALQERIDRGYEYVRRYMGAIRRFQEEQAALRSKIRLTYVQVGTSPEAPVAAQEFRAHLATAPARPAAPAKWTLRMLPSSYLARYPEGAHAQHARSILEGVSFSLAPYDDCASPHDCDDNNVLLGAT